LLKLLLEGDEDMKLQTKDYLEICPGCLACYNQGRLTFYWFRLNKETTLKQIEAALNIEEIHKRAKTPYVCGGDEVHIQDNDFNGGEYMTAKEIFGYVQLLRLVPSFDYVRAFKEIYLMNDEFVYNQFDNSTSPSDMFKRFAEDVMTFDNDREFNTHLEDIFTETNGINDDNPLINYIQWDAVVRDMKMDWEEVEISGTTYAWRSI
tara:strand:- start:608 stop:1225 length:618 start_codon:yes stop_codon:yes gene_type:complete